MNGGVPFEFKPFDQGRKIGFMHIPKTSGSAMRYFLVRVLGLKSYFDKPDRCQRACLPGFIDPELPPGENYLAHVSLDTLLKGCRDGQYLTVFREPSSRILSHWLYWRMSEQSPSEPPAWINLVLRCRGKLSDILLDPELACQFDNRALRMLVWPHPLLPDRGFIDAKDDEELLQLAAERLKRFSFLDVVENPSFEANLKQWLGTDLEYGRTNETEAMPEPLRSPLHRELTREALGALEARSRLDRALWAAVAAARLPGINLDRLTRETLIKNVARYSAIMS